MNKKLIFLVGCFFSICLSQSFAMTEDQKVLMDVIIQDEGKEKFSLHQANYALVGENDLKLQFSFKYRVLENYPLFVDFTEKLFWDIYKNSKPFRDINYHPGIFYRFVIKDKRLKSIDLGYLHNSNGKSGQESRSVDQIYMRNSFFFGSEFLDLVTSLELHYNFNSDDLNTGITEYMGYYTLRLLFQNLMGSEQWRLGVTASGGKRVIDFDNGFISTNLIYDFPGDSFNPEIFAQFYYGRMENLLDYERRKKEIRLGFLLYY